FHEPRRKLFGLLRLAGDEKKPQVVRLVPAGAVRGRLVDEDGRPLAGVAVRLYHPDRPAEEIHDRASRARPIETDADGKFLIDEVIPGVKFSLSFHRGRQALEPSVKRADSMAQPGKTLDLGEVKVKPGRAGQVE